jgi:hypothetical protein
MTDDHVSDADPCAQCPWRTANHGKRHPDGWYTQTNRFRLWSRLRRGEPMSCHPTDPGNPLSERARNAGYKPAPAGTKPLECRGALILVQRELHLFVDKYGMQMSAYRAGRSIGLTRAGIQAIAMRLTFGGMPLVGPAKMARPDLNAPVGHPDLPWDPADGPA